MAKIDSHVKKASPFWLPRFAQWAIRRRGSGGRHRPLVHYEDEAQSYADAAAVSGRLRNWTAPLPVSQPPMSQRVYLRGRYSLQRLICARDLYC